MRRQKRFTISYDGPPLETSRGKIELTGASEVVEEYDDETTARVRVAVLNHGLPEKVYTLNECVDPEGDLYVEVDTDDDDEEDGG